MQMAFNSLELKLEYKYKLYINFYGIINLIYLKLIYNDLYHTKH